MFSQRRALYHEGPLPWRFLLQGSHNHTPSNGREPRPNLDFLEIWQLDVSVNFVGLCFAKIAPDPRPLGQCKSWCGYFFTFVTTFFQPRSSLAENGTNLSFSHENNGFIPLFNLGGGCQARYGGFGHLKISENKLRGQNKFDDNVPSRARSWNHSSHTTSKLYKSSFSCAWLARLQPYPEVIFIVI